MCVLPPYFCSVWFRAMGYKYNIYHHYDHTTKRNILYTIPSNIANRTVKFNTDFFIISILQVTKKILKWTLLQVFEGFVDQSVFYIIFLIAFYVFFFFICWLLNTIRHSVFFSLFFGKVKTNIIYRSFSRKWNVNRCGTGPNRKR